MSLLCSVHHIFKTRIFSSIQLLVNKKFFHQSRFKFIKLFFISPSSIYATCCPTLGKRSPFTPLTGTEVTLFLLLISPQPRPVHSRWLSPLCGMGFHCRKDCSPGFFLTHSTLASKLFSSRARVGSASE